MTGLNINPIVIILARIIVFFSKTFPITPGGWFVSKNLKKLFIILFYPMFLFDNILSLFILEHILRISHIFANYIASSLSLNFEFKNLKVGKLNRKKMGIEIILWHISINLKKTQNNHFELFLVKNLLLTKCYLSLLKCKHLHVL